MSIMKKKMVYAAVPAILKNFPHMAYHDAINIAETAIMAVIVELPPAGTIRLEIDSPPGAPISVREIYGVRAVSDPADGDNYRALKSIGGKN